VSKRELYTGIEAKKRRIYENLGGKVPKQNHKREHNTIGHERQPAFWVRGAFPEGIPDSRAGVTSVK
jgi:hypothetical protein